jgi:hypothetical protein
MSSPKNNLNTYTIQVQNFHIHGSSFSITCSVASDQSDHSCCMIPQFSSRMKVCACQLCMCCKLQILKVMAMHYQKVHYSFYSTTVPIFSPSTVCVQIVSDGMVV